MEKCVWRPRFPNHSIFQSFLVGLCVAGADMARVQLGSYGGERWVLHCSILLATLLLAGLAGVLVTLWVQFSQRASAQAGSWRHSLLLLMPLLIFVWWVPSTWVLENWGRLKWAERALAGGAYLVLFLICLLFVRSLLWLRESRRASWVRALAGGVSLLLALVMFFADARILVGLYEEFHVGLAGLFVMFTACGVAFLVPRRRWIDDLHWGALSGPFGCVALCFFGLILTKPSSFSRSDSLIFAKLVPLFQGPSSESNQPQFGFPFPAFSRTDYGVPNVKGFNVVLLTIDALRADHVGAYGYHRNTTPNIDRLIGKSLLFENAFTQAPKTIDSLPSIYSGLYPSNLGRDYDHKRVKRRNPAVFYLTGETTLLAERMRAKGYETGAFLRFDSTYWQGLDRGFDRFETPHKRLTERALSFIKSAKAPFFAVLHYGFPHAPYEKHDRYDFGDEAIDVYDSEIAWSDYKFGKLIAGLKKRKIFDRTIIIISADHGEEFQEHGGKNHSRKLYKELLHVPLVVFIPGVEAQRIEEGVELVDLAPMLNELFELGANASDFDGQSLLATRAGQRTGIRRGSYSENVTRKRGIEATALATKEWRGIYFPRKDTFELYDLVADPTEQVDLGTQRPDVVRNFKAKMKRRPLRREAAEIR